MTTKIIGPITPGEVLKKEFLTPFGLSQKVLADTMGASPRRVNEIVLGKRRITADTALRLSRLFSMSEGFWMNLQDRYGREIAAANLERPSPR